MLQIEYVFGCTKLIAMVAMIMYNVIISGINASNGLYPRFWTYQKPYSFFTNELSINNHHFDGNTARLLGIWTAMNTIFFSMQGMFSVSVTAAENRRLESEESIKIATRKIALRTITLYTLLVFSVGLNVPSDDAEIQDSAVSTIRLVTTSSPSLNSSIKLTKSQTGQSLAFHHRLYPIRHDWTAASAECILDLQRFLLRG